MLDPSRFFGAVTICCARGHLGTTPFVVSVDRDSFSQLALYLMAVSLNSLSSTRCTTSSEITKFFSRKTVLQAEVT